MVNLSIRLPESEFQSLMSVQMIEHAVQQHGRPLATTLDFQDHKICEIDGDVTVQSAEVCSVVPGADTHDVKRLLLAECSIVVFHISSYAWTNPYSEACQKWLSFVACCVEHQCDLITGDGNFFCSTQFQGR